MSEPRARLFISLYTDEDVTDQLPELLRQRGYEASSTAEAGMLGVSDEEQLRFASRHGWTILTYNRDDFIQLARQWHDAEREHAGIIISQQFSKKAVGELLRQVCTLLDTVSAEDTKLPLAWPRSGPPSTASNQQAL